MRLPTQATFSAHSNKSTIGRLIVFLLVASAPLAGRAEPIEEAPLTVSGEMRAWVETHAPRRLEPRRRTARLHEAVADLRIVPIEGRSPTAAEAFDSREADCVGWAHLWVALGRTAGLDVGFVLFEEPLEIRTGSRWNTAVTHMAIEVRRGTDSERFDAAGSCDEGRTFRRIDDRTAHAVLLSNRGVERLQHGETAAALERLERATRLAPELPSAWTNLGVALRREGRWAEAERAYRLAIAHDPDSLVAWRNLALLLSARIEADER